MSAANHSVQRVRMVLAARPRFGFRCGKSRNTWASALGFACALLAAWLSVLGCGGAAAFAQALDPSTARAASSGAAYFQSAQRYIELKQYRSAEIELRNTLQQDGTHHEARLLLGRVRLELGDPKGALTEFRRALEAGYDRTTVVPLLARALLETGQAKRVLDEFAGERLGNADSQADLDLIAGGAYLELGNPQAAQRQFTRVLQHRADDLRALRGVALAHERAGEFEAALQAIDRLLARSPNESEAKIIKANMFVDRGNRAGARKLLEEITALVPEHWVAQEGLVVLRIEERDFTGARTRLDLARKFAPNHANIPYLEALLAARQGKTAQARKALVEAFARQSDHLLSLILAGELDLADRAAPAAIEHLRRAVLVAPRNPTARRLLASAHAMTGRPDRALETLQPLVDEPNVTPELLALAAELHLSAGDTRAALQAFERAGAHPAARANGGTLQYKVRAAQARIAGGDAKGGIEALQLLARTERSSHQPDLALMAVRLQRKEFDAALDAHKGLAAKQPESPLTHHLRGLALAGKGDDKGARASFEQAVAIAPAYTPALDRLVRLDLAAGDVAAARGHFARMLERAPSDASAMLHQAAVLRASGGEGLEIVGLYERAVRAEPNAAQPRIALIEHYLRGRDGKTALKTAQAAMLAIPNEPALMEALGTAQFAAGLPADAIKTFQEVIVRRPRADTPWIRMAGVQASLKDYDAAVRSLRQALKLTPEHPELRRDIALYLARSGKVDAALVEARAVQRERSKEPLGFVIEGDVLAQQARWKPALDAYQEAHKRAPGPELAGKILTARRALQNDERVVLERQTPFNTIFVGENALGLRTLRFGRDGVRQSVVKPGDPLHIELPYVRLMLSGVALVDAPRSILVVGLGGGSLPMLCRTLFPDATIDAVDIDPEVIAVAKSHFGFREDKTMRAHAEDGRAFIARHTGRYDVILLDAYGADNVPRALATQEFLAAVRHALKPEGVVVSNIWAPDRNPLYASMVRTYESVFPGVRVLGLTEGLNRIVLARPAPGGLEDDRLVQRARDLARRGRLRDDLPGMVVQGLRVERSPGAAARVLIDADRPL